MLIILILSLIYLFRLMRAMGEYTKINPDMRIKKLIAFNRRLQEQKESSDVFREWGMELDECLVELPGRELRNEMIVFGGGVKYGHIIFY